VNVKSAKAASKKAPAKIGDKTVSKAIDNEVSDDDGKESKGDIKMDEDDSSESLEMINTQSKRAPSELATMKKAKSLPKVGQKRVRKAKKGDDEEDEDDEDGEEDASAHEGGNDDEDSARPVKKRKVGGGKAKAEPKPKKAPKRPTEFKKGKWNPHVELLDNNKYREHPQDGLFIECCIRCNNRNIIRAAYTGNDRLL
jgi:hypothetical protein